MITQDQIEARARQIVARGLPRAMAIDEARIELQYESGLAARATAAKAQSEAPPRDVLSEHGFDAQDKRMAASLNAALDPGQQQARFARHAQLTAQLDALDTEIEAWLAPRRQRRQAIIDELAQL